LIGSVVPAKIAQACLLLAVPSLPRHGGVPMSTLDPLQKFDRF